MIKKVEVSYTEEADYEKAKEAAEMLIPDMRIHRKNIPNPYKRAYFTAKNKANKCDNGENAKTITKHHLK